MSIAVPTCISQQMKGTQLRNSPTNNAHRSVHSGTVGSGQHMKAAWVSMGGWIDGWMGKTWCVCVLSAGGGVGGVRKES